MKIRKILAGFIAVAIALPMTVISSSAATITLLPSGGSKKYAIDIEATQTTAKISFSTSSAIRLSQAAIKGGTGGVLTSGSSNYSVKEITDTKFNKTNITSSAISFGISSGENRLPIGDYSTFVWTGRIVLTDSSKDPVKDLGINLNDIKYNATFTVDGYSDVIDFASFKATVVEIGDASTFSKDTAVRIKSLINGGRGFTRAEKDSIKSGSDFKATITLKDAVASGGIALVGFSTDLYEKPQFEIANAGTKTVTINIPKYYIYNEEESKKYGEDFLFENMYLTGASEFTSVVITYSEGTAATTTTTAATTQGNTTTTPSAVGDSAEDELYLNYSSLTLNTNASANLKASYSDVTWTTSNRNIVRVFNTGKITAVATGTATITAKNANGDKVSCNVTVINSSKPLTSYTLNTTKGTVYVDSSYSISKAQLSRTDHTDKINWTSSDTSVATVNASGNVTIVGVGKATITATTSSGLTSTCVLTAKNPSLTLASSTATVNVNGTVTIKPTIKPTSSIVAYESMNEAVATVDKNGVVKGVGKGTARIEVTSNKGIVKIFTVTVN